MYLSVYKFHSILLLLYFTLVTLVTLSNRTQSSAARKAASVSEPTFRVRCNVCSTPAKTEKHPPKKVICAKKRSMQEKAKRDNNKVRTKEKPKTSIFPHHSRKSKDKVELCTSRLYMAL